MLRRLYLWGSLSHQVKLLLAILVQEWLPAVFPLSALAMPEEMNATYSQGIGSMWVSKEKEVFKSVKQKLVYESSASLQVCTIVSKAFDSHKCLVKSSVLP